MMKKTETNNGDGADMNLNTCGGAGKNSNTCNGAGKSWNIYAGGGACAGMRKRGCRTIRSDIANIPVPPRCGTGKPLCPL